MLPARAAAAPSVTPAATTAPTRLFTLRAAVVTGSFAVLTVEVAGALEIIRPLTFMVAWIAFFAVIALLIARYRSRLVLKRGSVSWKDPLVAGIGILAAAELVVALLAEPNNYDSQTYHLPKIEHWVAQGHLGAWPTAIHRQVTIPPGAEYLLLHLRLLTGGDALYHLVQWGAGVGCLIAVSRIAAQLGGGRRAQLIAAFVVATTPMVVMQVSSTQTDLVAAFWAACVASLALDGLHRRTGFLALGAATGLAAVTKTSALLGVGPMLVLWGLAQLRLARTPGKIAPGKIARTGAVSAAILLTALAITGPFLIRMTAEFGNPLGPPRLRESIPMQRHDPGSVLVNGLRIANTALDTPVAPVREGTAGAIIGLAHAIGVDPQGREITFGRTTFPVPAWYPDEDRVAFPITGLLLIISVTLALLRRLDNPNPKIIQGYAAAVTAAAVLYAVTIKWQPWGNRLLLFAVVLGAPLAGLWLDAVLRRRGRVPKGLVAAVLAVAALAALLSVGYGFPRRLVGTGSVFTSDEWETRFLRRPQWADDYRWAADAVNAAGARRVGLVQGNDDWEYPWWLLLRDADIAALTSTIPGHPGADPATVEAIVCTGTRAACAKHVPAGWRLEFRDYVGYALPG